MTGAAYYIPLDELADVIGDVAALRLVAAMGGTRFYVRADIREDSPIVAAIGMEAATVLAKHIATGIGGLAVEIPRGPSNFMAEYRRRLLDLAATPGLTEAQIAQEMKVHGRTVRRARAKLREDVDSDQGNLF
ncbi:hypothetical protein [Methylobacterium sp. Leaf85]|uniref:hypothetical protein n=1 Tax=Methylobacterium sp. Leaf85 TaxID=1736241 RepID=UPI0006F607AF|nr:hypothetical protein [Methylobacterium sp. Leaf85]KQO53089.1 hypothetical protein ASF08_19385 [Methylobacterium sp. Leaf85]